MYAVFESPIACFHESGCRAHHNESSQVCAGVRLSKYYFYTPTRYSSLIHKYNLNIVHYKADKGVKGIVLENPGVYDESLLTSYKDVQ